MVIPILCLVALSFLVWVILLKTEIQELKKENRKLRTKLELGVRKMTKDVEISKGKRTWGEKEEGPEKHPLHIERDG